MREVKYKAWIKDEQKMVDVVSIDFRIKEIAYEEQRTIDNIQQAWYEFRDFNEIELLEHTGLKDKNGVKIFEGDVFIDEDGCIGVVRYSEQFAWFIIEWYENPHSKEPLDDDALGNINIHNMEIIGNIYQNKEVLNEQSCNSNTK